MNLKFTFLLFACFLPALQLYSQYQIIGKPENLGYRVNTNGEEHSPIVSSDGKTLYFVRERNPRNIPNTGTYDTEDFSFRPIELDSNRNIRIDDSQDIWFSQMQEDGKWSKAKHMDFPLNQRKYNNILYVSWDGNTIMIKGAYQNGEYAGPGFSFCLKEGGRWSLHKMLDIAGFEEMNKDSAYGGCLSADRKVLLLYFSEQKDIPADIYVSFPDRHSGWTRPMNLGPIINSDEKDVSPFLSDDGLTLYFSSKRDGGYGGQDIWFSKRLDETWTNWSIPENMGPAINSSGNDSYFSIPASEEYAYFSTYNHAQGKSDIVRVKIKRQ